MTIPTALLEAKQWVNWRYDQTDDGKRTKVPYRPDGTRANAYSPTTWSAHDDLSPGHFQGFCLGNGFVGIDLDGCRQRNGDITPWAQEILGRFANTYAEVSPSGTGIKIFARGSFTERKSKKLGGEPIEGKKPAVEMHGKGYFAVTGDAVGAVQDVVDCQAAIDWLHDKYWPAVATSPAPAMPYRPVGDVERRVIAYLEKCPPAISGQGGHNRTFTVAAALVHGWLLSPESAFPLLQTWNARCTPPWSDGDLMRKLTEAAKAVCEKTPGWIVNAEVQDESDVDYSEFENSLPAKKICPGCGAACEMTAKVCVCGLELRVSAEVAEVPEAEEPQELPSPVDPGPFPLDLALNAPGVLAEIVAHDLRTAMYPQPTLALGGALGVLSTITGRKVAGHYNTRTNLYILGLARSGDGKNNARKLMKRLLIAAGAQELLGNERIGSHAGIISRLDVNPATLMPVDEIGDLFAIMKSTGTKLGAIGNIEPVLKSLYSDSGDTWKGDALANLDHVKSIDQPHLVLHGVCPPANYWGNLTAANVENGLIARFLVFEAGSVDPVWLDKIEEPPANIVALLRAWYLFQPTPGEFGAMHPTPREAEYDPEALQIVREHVEAIAKRKKLEDDRTSATWARCAEKTQKLALIAACARCCDPAAETPKVTADDVRWAKRIAIWSTRRMVWRLFESVAESAEDERKKDILKLVPLAPNEIERSRLTRKTQKMKRTDRSSAINDLLESRQMRVRKQAAAKGPAKEFYFRVA